MLVYQRVHIAHIKFHLHPFTISAKRFLGMWTTTHLGWYLVWIYFILGYIPVCKWLNTTAMDSYIYIYTYIYIHTYTYMYKFLPSCNQTWQWTNPHNGKRSINGTFPIAMFGCWRVSQNMATGYALTFPPSLRTWNIPNPSQNSKRSMGDFPICGSVLK